MIDIQPAVFVIIVVAWGRAVTSGGRGGSSPGRRGEGGVLPAVRAVEADGVHNCCNATIGPFLAAPPVMKEDGSGEGYELICVDIVMEQTDKDRIKRILDDLNDTSNEKELTGIDIIIDWARSSAEGQAFLGESGACKTLSDLLSSVRNKNEEDACNLLLAIRYIMRRELAKHTSNLRNIELFREVGLIDALAETFKKHIGSSKVTEASCWCIMILASDNEDNQVAMANAGMADTLLESLNQYATNDDVIEIICRALRNMSSNMSIAAYFVSEGIADPITGTIVVHTEHPAQLEAALWVVVNLTYNPDIASILGASGICVAVTDVLRANLRQAGVLMAACWAIRNLSCGSVFNFNQFVHTEVCPTLVQVVRDNSDDLHIVSTALWAIANMSCDVTMCARMGSDEGAVQTIMSCIKAQLGGGAGEGGFPEESQEVLEAGVWAVQNLASGGRPSRTNLQAHGVVEMIVACLARGEIVVVQTIRETVCGGVLANLMCEEDSVRSELQRALREAQLGGLLCGLLQQERWIAMPSTAYAVCRGLRGFAAGNEENAQILDALGACDLATRVMGLHRDIPEVVSSACDVLLVVYFSARPEELKRLQEVGRAEDEQAEAAEAAAATAAAEAAVAAAAEREKAASQEAMEAPLPPPPGTSCTDVPETADSDVAAKESVPEGEAEGEGDFEPESVDSIAARMREVLLGGASSGKPEEGGAAVPVPQQRVSQRVIDAQGRVVSKSFEEMLSVWAPRELREANGWTLLDALVATETVTA